MKVGDKVEFKSDYEGSGIIAKIDENGWSYKRYAIRSEHESPGYPFHKMAMMDWDLMCMVVWVDEDHVWAA